MMLSGDEIRRRQELGDQKGGLRIDPFDPGRLNPNSYNVTLHSELLVYEEVVLDAAKPNRYRRIEIPADGLTLNPSVLYLGRTVEYTETDGLVPILRGRGSLSRLGLFVSPGGALGDTGYRGTWTMELHCVQPVRIYAGMQIAHIAYLTLEGIATPYESEKYQNSRDIQASKMFRELGDGEADPQMELDFGSITRVS